MNENLVVPPMLLFKDYLIWSNFAEVRTGQVGTSTIFILMLLWDFIFELVEGFVDCVNVVCFLTVLSFP